MGRERGFAHRNCGRTSDIEMAKTPLVQPLTPQLLNMVGRPGVLGGGGGGQQVGVGGWGGGVKPLRGGVEVPLGRAHFSADGGS